MTHYENQLISICIPTYNRYELLQKAVKSCLYNKAENIEIIIQDNNSTDNTSEIVNLIIDERIKYEKNESNIGPVRNIIKSFQRAKGEYIFALTDDDYLLPGSLETVRAFINKYQPSVFKTDIFMHLIKSRQCNYYSYLSKSGLISNNDYTSKAKVFISAHILTGLCFRKKALDFDILLQNDNQWYLSQLIVGLLSNKTAYLAEPIAIHIWENETHWGINSNEKEILLSSLIDTLITIKNHVDYSLIKEIVTQISNTENLLNSRGIRKLLNHDDYYEILEMKKIKKSNEPNYLISKMKGLLRRVKNII